MIEFIFTIDYEIFGDGTGALIDMIYNPTNRLTDLFNKYDKRFVAFIEAAELDVIHVKNYDPTIDMIFLQIQKLYHQGFELGLHLHPQWYNGVYDDHKWILDYSEYNICTLPYNRLEQIVRRSIKFLQTVIGKSDFKPVSFRAGNWLFQPSRNASIVLAECGIKVDSSVFKGGLLRQHKLDYRNALKNGYYWTFSDSVDTPNPKGALLEIPIYTKMVPFWKMATAKRIGLQRMVTSARCGNGSSFFDRFADFLRLLYPLKLDFCRMTEREIILMLEKEVREDRRDPAKLRPVVAIGHTKDLYDLETVENLLRYLEYNNIKVSTFEEVYRRCDQGLAGVVL